MINLLPKETIFFDLIEGLGEHVEQSALHLHKLVHAFPNIDEHLGYIRDIEHKADGMAHTALDRLDRTFITPFDREDIHELVGGLDDIIDEIDALAKRFSIFHIQKMDQEFLLQVDVLVEATKVVNTAVHGLRKKRKFADMREHLIAIHHQESVGDDIYHSAISRLFDGKTEPLEVMKWWKMHEYLEDAIDECEDVGNTLERIMLKNS